MNLHRSSQLLAFLLLAGASTAPESTAQTPANPMQQRGISSIWSAGLSLRTTTAPGTPVDPTLLKAPGDMSTPPLPWTSQSAVMGIPDYSMAAMFAFTNLPSYAIFQNIEIDAHSTGNDMIPRMLEGSTPGSVVAGVPDVGSGGTNGNWLAYSMSVSNDAAGTPGSYIASLTDPGSEIISYYTDLSQRISTSLLGRTFVEQRRSDLGLAGYPDLDVDAYDLALGAFTYDPDSPRTNVLFPVGSGSYYFSVTPDFVTWWTGANGPGASMDFVTNAGAPHAGDIYRIQWNSTSMSWTPPQVYRSAGALRAGSTYTVDDLDALAVNDSTNTILFSVTFTEANKTTPQLLYYQEDEGGANKIVAELRDRLRNGATVNVFDRAGLQRERDDVDSLCGWDPEGSAVDPIVGFAPTSSLLIPALSHLSNPMGFSMARVSLGAGQPDNLVFHVTGWGDAPVVDSSLVFFARFASSAITPNTDPMAVGGLSWIALPAMARSATQDTIEVTLPGFVPGSDLYVQAFAVMMGSEGDEDESETGFVAGSLVSEIHY